MGSLYRFPGNWLLLVFWAVTSDCVFSVFFDFFVIYPQNGFFLEASESLEATHFFILSCAMVLLPLSELRAGG